MINRQLTHSIKLKINAVTRSPCCEAWFSCIWHANDAEKHPWSIEILVQSFLGDDIAGLRKLIPQEDDRGPLVQTLLKLHTVNDFCIRAALTTSPLSTVRWTWCHFDDPKSGAFSTSLHRRQINPHVLAVKYSRAHLRPNKPCKRKSSVMASTVASHTLPLLPSVRQPKFLWVPLRFSFSDWVTLRFASG